MPIYEYECTKCGQHEEVWQNISDAPLKKCGTCKGKLKKLISQSTFHLKGSGWYVTDYSSKHSGSEVKKEASAENQATTTKTNDASGKTSKKAASTTDAKTGKD